MEILANEGGGVTNYGDYLSCRRRSLPLPNHYLVLVNKSEIFSLLSLHSISLAWRKFAMSSKCIYVAHIHKSEEKKGESGKTEIFFPVEYILSQRKRSFQGQ